LKIAVLTTTPDDWGDLACHYGAVWTRRSLIPWIREKGFEVFDLQDAHCNKAEFDAEVKKKYSYFKGFGHGNKTQFAGYNNRILQDAAKDDFSVFNETAVSHLSCSTAAELGKKFPLIFKGYRDVYYFMVARTTPDPFQDKLAKPYFDSDFEYDRAILSGKTHEEAIAACKAKYKEWYDKSGPYERQYLLYDASILQPYGNPKYVHPAPPPPPPPEFPCPWSDFKGPQEEVQKHVLATHCPKCPELPDACKPFVCGLPAWFRKLLGCKIP